MSKLSGLYKDNPNFLSALSSLHLLNEIDGLFKVYFIEFEQMLHEKRV